METPFINVTDASGVRRFPLPARLTMGRHSTNNVFLIDGLASRFHCVIEKNPDGYVLKDLQSSNGTLLNGQRVQTAQLADGDIVAIGSTQILFRDPANPRAPRQLQSPTPAAPAAGDPVTALANLVSPPGQEIDLMASDEILDELEVIDDEPIPMIEAVAAAAEDDDGEPESAASVLRRIADNIPNKDFDIDRIELINARGKAIMDESKRDRHSENLNLFRIVLLICFRTNASDIHLESRPDDYLMRMRIDGSLIDLTTISMEMGIKLCAIVKLLCDLDTTQKNIVQEGHFAARVPMPANMPRRPGLDAKGRRVDYRVSFVPTLYGQKLVIRVFDTANAPALIDDLQLPTQMANEIGKQLQLGSNIILVCGPTGSGKTTTLYAMLRSCGVSHRNILTIEDPVEIQLVGTTQLPVDDANGKSFAALLRSSLRQDPDVIMVGEIRDPETAQIALQAAITGHLVFSSVHTRDTVGTIFRLLDLGCEPFMVAQGLRIVVAQRLIRKLCVNCRKPYPPSAADLAKLGPAGANVRTLYAPGGCSQCLGSGYAGRRGIFELLNVDDKIRDCITHHPVPTQIHALLAEQNFVPLMQAGYQLVAQGITSFDEVEHSAG